MSHLAPRASSKESMRVIMVRQPIRSVGAGSEGSRLPVQLAIGVIVSVGVLVVVWLIGFVGFHLGFAPLMRVPGLEQSAGGGLVAGIRGMMSFPASMMRVGIDHPLWLMLGFAAIAIPAAGHGAVRAAAPGGPRPHVLTLVFSYAGVIAAGVFSIAALWWVFSGMRGGLVQLVPLEVTAMQRWVNELRLAAVLDVFVLAAMSLWVVLVMRLSVPRWLRALAASVSFTVLAIVFAAASMSNVTVGQVTAGRSVIRLDEGGHAILLGEVGQAAAWLRVGDSDVLGVELVELPQRMQLVDQQSIARFAGDAAGQ